MKINLKEKQRCQRMSRALKSNLKKRKVFQNRIKKKKQNNE